MYQVDEMDEVKELEGIPQSSIGAPCPFVMSDEFQIVIAFYLQSSLADFDGTSIRVVGHKHSKEAIAIVEIERYHAYMFGPPNDEAFSGHPLSGRGLRPYSVAEILNSSWIRSLAQMNSVHPYHDQKVFDRYRHFIFAFHDSTFECVAQGYRLHLAEGSIESVIPRMKQLMDWE